MHILSTTVRLNLGAHPKRANAGKVDVLVQASHDKGGVVSGLCNDYVQEGSFGGFLLVMQMC